MRAVIICTPCRMVFVWAARLITVSVELVPGATFELPRVLKIPVPPSRLTFISPEHQLELLCAVGALKHVFQSPRSLCQAVWCRRHVSHAVVRSSFLLVQLIPPLRLLQLLPRTATQAHDCSCRPLAPSRVNSIDQNTWGRQCRRWFCRR